jgi:hypothetical protein
MATEVSVAPRMNRGPLKIIAGTAVLIAAIALFGIGGFLLMVWSVFELLMMPF